MDKTFKSGKGIDFTRVNPTCVINAIKRDLDKRGTSYDYHIARTGSRYIKFELGETEVSIRSANHTTASYFSQVGESGLYVAANKRNGGIVLLEIDLALFMDSRAKAADIRNLLAEIEKFNGIGYAAVTEDDVPFLAELGVMEEAQYQCGFGKRYDEELEEMRREEVIKAAYEDYKKTIEIAPAEFVASSGIVFRKTFALNYVAFNGRVNISMRKIDRKTMSEFEEFKSRYTLPMCYAEFKKNFNA